jgi:uncharacterized membrane protein YoaK (UPF0700 family)
MTGALVKLGQGLARQLAGMGGQRGGGEWRSWALLWAGLLAGAVLGAFLRIACRSAACGSPPGGRH